MHVYFLIGVKILLLINTIINCDLKPVTVTITRQKMKFLVKFILLAVVVLQLTIF